jgi:hypothetical protein
MKYLKVFLILSSLLIFSCTQYPNVGSKKIDSLYYTSKGFALIYNEDLFLSKIINKKIDNSKIVTMHRSLKKNTKVKIINPKNLKSIVAKVVKKVEYPPIFNIIISAEIASILDLDINNPYIEVLEIKKNKTFVAKESSIFEEEKNVANKVPINDVVVDDLSVEKNDSKEIITKKKKFILVISDFYYSETAYTLKNDLINKTNNNTISVKKISNNKYRLIAGPFNNFKALKSIYISLNNLGFENLNIYRE